MAGTLPGVESARRRRIHQSSSRSAIGTGHGYTRRPTFCLFTSNHDSHNLPVTYLQRSGLSRASQDEELGELAREAKERLDEKLRAQRKPEIRRNSSDLNEVGLRCINRRTSMIRDLQTELFRLKKTRNSGGGSKRFIWGKLGWKPWEQEECAVCLEEFRLGENLMNLPCAHKFHSRCLTPWLEKNSHCPCCRKAIFSNY
ncbi:hypothetical protein Nepgr_020828 [Nepenthes gracilis]|uniref:RING-type domain-containing protein n=1 Tax=Nepenthes gracilis TaxID=150966 RepID=A0AAD3XVE5_NEPGR|nr:hypothetical protein Nepgr_020828 [Nepenthes gracilis]